MCTDVSRFYYVVLQLVHGPHPTKLKRVETVPEEFSITEEMVKNSLTRGMSFEEEIHVCGV